MASTASRLGRQVGRGTSVLSHVDIHVNYELQDIAHRLGRKGAKMQKELERLMRESATGANSSRPMNILVRAQQLGMAVGERNWIIAVRSFIDRRNSSFDVVGAKSAMQELLKRRTRMPQAVFKELCEGFAIARKPMEVEALIKCAKSMSWEVDGSHFLALLKAYSWSGRTDQLLSVLKNLERQEIQCTPQMYSYVLGQLGWKGMVGEARELYDELVQTGKADLTEITTKIMGVYNRIGQSSSALHLFETIRERDLTTVTYNTAINAKMRLKQDEEAMALYEDMKKRSIRPDAFTLCSIVRILGRKGEMNRARRLVVNARRRGDADTHLYNSLIAAYIDDSNLEMANDILRFMYKNKIQPDVVSYNTLIGGYGLAGKLEAATSLFEKLQKENLSPSDQTYVALVMSHAKAGDVGGAKSWMHQMERAGFRRDEDIYKALISGYAKAATCLSDLMEAVRFREEARDGDVRISARTALYEDVMEARSKFLDLEGIEADKREMEQLGVPLSEKIYTALLYVYGHKEMPSQAVAVFAEMRQRGIQPTIFTYNMMVRALTLCDKMDGAFSIVDEMEQIGMSPNSATFACVADSLTRRCLTEDKELNGKLKLKNNDSRLESGSRALDELLKRKLPVSPRAMHQFVRFFAHHRESDKAYEAFTSLLSLAGKANPETTSMVMFELLRNDRPYDAVKAYETSRKANSSVGTSVMTALATAYGRCGDKKGLIQIEETVAKLGIETTTEFYAEMMRANIAVGAPAKASEILLKTKHDPAVEPTANYLTECINVYAALHDWHAARDIWQKFHQMELDPPDRAVELIFEALGNCRKLDELGEFYRHVQGRGLKLGEISKVALAVGYFKCRAFDKGMDVFRELIEAKGGVLRNPFLCYKMLVDELKKSGGVLPRKRIEGFFEKSYPQVIPQYHHAAKTKPVVEVPPKRVVVQRKKREKSLSVDMDKLATEAEKHGLTIRDPFGPLSAGVLQDSGAAYAEATYTGRGRRGKINRAPSPMGA